jgi:hypothetical protein
VADAAVHADRWLDLPGKLLSNIHAHRDCTPALVFSATANAILAGAHPPFGGVPLPFVDYVVRLGRACGVHCAAKPSHGAAGEFKEIHAVQGGRCGIGRSNRRRVP